MKLLSLSQSVAAVFLISLTAGAGAGAFELKDTAGDHLDVMHDGKVMARYMYGHDISSQERRDETYKPFLHIFNPEGTAPITKGAGGVLPHHRGIYIGWNEIKIDGKTYDRWHMKGGDQVHEKFPERKAGDKEASFTSLVRWQGATQEETIIEEERKITIRAGEGTVYEVVDVSSKLKAVMGDTSLNQDLEHSGLQFRADNLVDRTHTAYLYPKAGADPHKDRDYPWFGMTYVVGDKKYSVVYLSHPENPKGGAASAYRDYGRFGETWNPTIPKGATQEFRVRFLIATGEMLSPEAIQKAWNEYAGKNEPVPQVTAMPAEKSKFADPNNPTATPAPKAK